MITTTFKLFKVDKIEPLNDQSIFETIIPPLQRVKDFSDEGFSLVILPIYFKDFIYIKLFIKHLKILNNNLWSLK